MISKLFLSLWTARWRIFKYLSAGAGCAALEYFIFLGLYKSAEFNVHLTNFISLFLAAVCNYMLSRWWIFGSSQRKIIKEIYFFVGLIFVSFIFNHACFLFLYKLVELDYRICKVAAMIVTTILNYKAKRHIVFLNSNI